METYNTVLWLWGRPYKNPNEEFDANMTVLHNGSEKPLIVAAAAENQDQFLGDLLRDIDTKVDLSGELSMADKTLLSMAWEEAWQNNSLDVIRDLIRYDNIDANLLVVHDNVTKPILAIAAANNEMEWVTQLLAKGADVNAIFDEWQTALSESSRCGHIAIRDYLLFTRGANPDVLVEYNEKK